MEKRKFYITTAIAYASKKPHAGNTYDPVLADMIARYKKLMGFDVFYLTGTDEHGQKIETAAGEAGVSSRAYVDAVAGEIRTICDMLNIGYDRFIRTTDDDHREAVSAIFQRLYDQDDIYKNTYEGKYCVPCESFFTPSQLTEGKCPDCGREVSDAKEEAYFFRLSKYQDRLAAYYEENPDFFLPDSRRAEMVNNFLKPGLADLCVSRSTFSWGIRVPFDPDHVIYVWLDALCNYITGVGYHPDRPTAQFASLWPCDLHVIGKDIVRFHTIYWPIFLMALGLPLPKRVLAHPWMLFGGEKMSKSKGNVIYADDLVRQYGCDAVRYYLLTEVPYAQDGSMTTESFVAKYNTDLANTIGNLVNRTVTMAGKYCGGCVERPAREEGNPLEDAARTAIAEYIGKMEQYRNAEAMDAVLQLARRCNKYIDETTPWLLAKSEADAPRLREVLYRLLESIRILAQLMAPAMPATAAAIEAQLGGSDCPFAAHFGTTARFRTGTPTPLFARIDNKG